MPTGDKTFKDLELLNVKIDVWIDEEEYKEIYEHITVDIKSNVKTAIEDAFHNSSKFKSIFVGENGKDKNPQNAIQNNYINNAEEGDKWKPLFFSKYLRAKIQENGTDAYTKCLDELVTFLQRMLPYQSPQSDQQVILQHLYYQELSACGKPGLESLGFAVQANELITKKEGTGRASHFSFELYKLWAKLNQGIGFLHSEQKMNAALAFNEVIREFRNWARCLQADEKGFWQSLLYDQAVLSRAELQEDLQFSYHTILTLKKLGERKREKKLIKEALAFRDMGRLQDAKRKIRILLSLRNDETNPVSIEEIFKGFENWKVKKNSIRYGTLGLLFDYYLLELEIRQNDLQKSKREKGEYEKFKNDLQYLNKMILGHKEKIIEIKTERVSYYRQIARFLKWLSECYKETKDGIYLSQIKDLYEEIKSYLLPHKESKHGLKYEVKLEDFDQYDYDKYTESLEKFYRNLTSAGMNDYIEDERKFLHALNEYERCRFLLYRFKELERDQRLKILENNLDRGKCENSLRCFYDGKDRAAFEGLLKCSEKKSLVFCPCQLFSKYLKSSGTHPVSQDRYASLSNLESYEYEKIMERENDHFLDRLRYRSRHPTYSKNNDSTKMSYHFVGLQRWNSQTPTLTLSQGGGYLLYAQDGQGKVILGIAIDPGFDFVDNLIRMGFTLKDIDFILLSHAHLDHIRDFEPIVSSLLDLKKREFGSTKKIHAMMTLGVYRHLEHVITNATLREFLADTYIIDIDKEIDQGNRSNFFMFKRLSRGSENEFRSIIPEKDDEIRNRCIEIEPTRAYHNDYSERSDSFGYIIKFYDDQNLIFSFGYTADSKWKSDIPDQYKDSDVICIHLGALIESELHTFEDYDKSGQHCDELIEKKGHPYLFGLLRFLKSIKKNKENKNKLVLISEFGEEMKGGIRIDFIRRLNQLIRDNESNEIKRLCLPVDIGLNIILARQYEKQADKQTLWETEPYRVWCYGCDNFVNYHQIQYRHFGYGGDEALFYFCKTCLKSKPENTLQDKMRSICEHGIPLQKAE